jgi:methionyl-tRNA formyltransferase
MRISVFLNNDLESNIALNCLLPELKKHTFNIYLSEKVGPSSHPTKALHYLDFLEREFLHNFLFPKVEAQGFRGFLTFDQVAKKYQVDLTHVNEIKSEEARTRISAFQPDLFVSIRFGKIFKGPVLSIPSRGIINLHSAILPDYKGVLGTVRAFMAGEHTIGSTIHYIKDSGIDTGDIISINSFKVSAEKSVLWHIVNLYPDAISTLMDIISHLSMGKEISASPQPAGGHYYSFPTENDFEILKQKGVTVFKLDEYAQLLSEYYAIDKHWIVEKLIPSGLPNSL